MKNNKALTPKNNMMFYQILFPFGFLHKACQFLECRSSSGYIVLALYA